MIVAFVESFKYVGHLIPVACLRIFLGGYYLKHGIASFQSDFLVKAYLAEDIRNHLPQNTAPEWFRWFLENAVIPNWQVFAVGLAVAQIFIGVSYIVGYLVRPAALVGILFSLGLMGAIGVGGVHGSGNIIGISLQATTFMLVIHLVLGWVGAGRCLGLDYYFYKRHRGLWW
jgi:thiosulfate dehydrogenase [quinone] large subunit